MGPGGISPQAAFGPPPLCLPGAICNRLHQDEEIEEKNEVVG